MAKVYCEKISALDIALNSLMVIACDPGRKYAAIVLALLSFMACAQDYPARPIRLVTPVAAGGGADATVRLLAHRLSASLQQRVVVDNRPGASNILGTDIVAKASADGYTLLWVSSTHAINAAVRRGTLPFDAQKDFAPITLFAKIPFLLVVHPTLGVNTVPELLALARAKPEHINYASAGIGSTSHFAGELLKKYSKINMLHVAYKGSAALLATVAGESSVLFTGPLSALPHTQSGRLRALAVTTAQRSRAFPELPTVAEGGAPGFEYTSWYGLLAPRHTPAAVIARVAQATAAATRHKELSRFLTGEGFELDGQGPVVFQRFLASEITKYLDLVPAIGLRAQ